MVLGLNGNTSSELNLFGVKTESKDGRYEEMKQKMIDKLLLPIIQKKWEIVLENHILIYGKLCLFFEKDEFYSYFLKIIDLTINDYKIKSNMKTQHEMFFILPPIQLKPEYEIYKLLYGIPPKNSSYDNLKLNVLKSLLKKDNMTFEKIKKKMNIN